MVRKLLMGFCVLLFVSVLISAVFAGPFDLLKKDSGTKVDAAALSNRSAMVMTKVRLATIAFAESIINVQMAVGKKEEAEKLKAVVENVKAKKDDNENTKKLIAEVNNATADLEKVDFKAKMDKSMADKFLSKAILDIGAGLVLDGLAVSDTKTLLTDAQAAVTKVSFTEIIKVKDVVSVSQFVAKEVPVQINSVQKLNTKLIDYAKSNKMPLPSKKDIEDKTKDMEKG